jgi:hypothetical protein
MNIKEVIQKRILDLKCKPLTVQTKTEIQKLQQTLDSADTYKNNSAKNKDTKEEYKDIEEFLYNRYNR